MAQQETTIGGDILRFLAAVPIIAINRPAGADGESSTLPAHGPTLFHHPLQPAERDSTARGSGKPLVWLPGQPVWNCLQWA
jgi:hypothetical protein